MILCQLISNTRSVRIFSVVNISAQGKFCSTTIVCLNTSFELSSLECGWVLTQEENHSKHIGCGMALPTGLLGVCRSTFYPQKKCGVLGVQRFILDRMRPCSCLFTHSLYAINFCIIIFCHIIHCYAWNCLVLMPHHTKYRQRRGLVKRGCPYTRKFDYLWRSFEHVKNSLYDV